MASKQAVSFATETPNATTPVSESARSSNCSSENGYPEQADEDDTVEIKEGSEYGQRNYTGEEDEESVSGEEELSEEQSVEGAEDGFSEGESECEGDTTIEASRKREDPGGANLTDDDEDAQSVFSDASAASEDSEDSQGQVDPAVLEEMERFQETFKGIQSRFRLINKIGEGTFSSVYKAEDLHYHYYENSWDFDKNDDVKYLSPPPNKKRRTGHDDPANHSGRRPKFVAIKKIYVTSSPARIQNELELLHDLSGCDTVVPLITAFRHQDQVVAVLPYVKHVDFREYFRTLTISDIRFYFRSLFKALEHVHSHAIIHRDIKPTNFLYDVQKGRGVLVDFGLAEREGTDCQFCMCQHSPSDRREHRPPNMSNPSQGYLKNDSRPSRRANRAGTRGFRAPEVLLKCTNQTTKIDIWSAGVILLTILSKRFPFFNSSDDVDAMIEIATIFGKQKMRSCAALHGTIFETNIPTIGEKGFPLEKIVLWATNRLGGSSTSDGGVDDTKFLPNEALAINFMTRCFELDPLKRISAQEALKHRFLACEDETLA